MTRNKDTQEDETFCFSCSGDGCRACRWTGYHARATWVRPHASRLQADEDSIPRDEAERAVREMVH